MAYDYEARERDRRALAWWSDPALYGPGGWTMRDAEIARESLRRRLARPVGRLPVAGNPPRRSWVAGGIQPSQSRR